MIQTPAPIVRQSTEYITQQGIPSGQHGYYLKWVRYYLDFCHKYNFKQGTESSLPSFLKKLEQKKLKINLREQAVRSFLACTLFPLKFHLFMHCKLTLVCCLALSWCWVCGFFSIGRVPLVTPF